MKTYVGFALKELKAQRLTSILILTAVFLSTVMTTAVGQSIGTLQAMRISQASSPERRPLCLIPPAEQKSDAEINE